MSTPTELQHRWDYGDGFATIRQCKDCGERETYWDDDEYEPKPCPARLVVTVDPWGKTVEIPQHPNTYGDRLFICGYTISWGSLAVWANSWETAWEVWCEQQPPCDLDENERAALERGEDVESIEWADGVGYVCITDLIVSELTI